MFIFQPESIRASVHLPTLDGGQCNGPRALQFIAPTYEVWSQREQ